MKVSHGLLGAFIFILDVCGSTKIPRMVSIAESSNLLNALRKVPSVSGTVNKYTPTLLSEQKLKHKHRCSLFNKKSEGIHSWPFNKNLRQYQTRDLITDPGELNKARNRRPTFVSVNPLSTFSSDLPESGRQWSEQVFNERLEKRNAAAKNSNARKKILKGRQNKAKVLGRLLMNNDSNKNYDDIQDDYVEDEDDDYSKGVNGKKMNWEDYQNEDGASVMELIALNTRHKTNMRQAYTNEYLYQ